MKRLYLSTRDKKIGGVCGGIAEYYAVDPTIIRIVTVVLTVMTGVVPMLICYALAWIIIPNEPPAK